MKKELSTLEQGRLNKILSTRINFGKELGVLTWKEAVNTIFDRKYSALVPSVKYNRIKYNRMSMEEQKEYDRKREIGKMEYYFYLKGKQTYIEVPKLLYLYADFPELPMENRVYKIDEYHW